MMAPGRIIVDFIGGWDFYIGNIILGISQQSALLIGQEDVSLSVSPGVI